MWTHSRLRAEATWGEGKAGAPKGQDFKFQVRNQDVGARAGSRGRYTSSREGLQGVSSEKEEGIFKSKEGQSQCSLELRERVQSEWCDGWVPWQGQRVGWP